MTVQVGLIVLVALALLGWFVSSRNNSKCLAVERRRTARFREALVEGSRLAQLAKDVRCPTCQANWASMQDVCDIGIVAGDAIGTVKVSKASAPSG